MNISVSGVLKLSAIIFVVGLTACTPKSKKNPSVPISCDAPQILNSAGTECISATSSDDLIALEATQAIIYYQREDGDYTGWGLHLWDDTGSVTDEVVTPTEWATPLLSAGEHPLYGAYYIIDLKTEDWADFKFILHNGDTKDLGGADQIYNRVVLGEDAFTFEGVAELFAEPLLEVPVLLVGAFGHFLDAAVEGAASLVYKPLSEANTVKLWHSPAASLSFDTETKTVSGGTPLTMAEEGMSDAQIAAYPHLADFKGYWLDATIEVAKSLVKEQLWVVETNGAEAVVRLTRVQTAPVLDALYFTAAQNAQLGAFTEASVTKFAVWAPTAIDVAVKVYNNSDLSLVQTLALTEDSSTGIWSASAATDLTDSYYLYDLSVFHYATDSIEDFEVTDPYSLGLSINSTFSQVVDLDASNLLPSGWAEFTSPNVTNPEDIAIYETHIRDLSLWDSTRTDASADGNYLAFADTSRESISHLQALRTAGMTAIQLLPAFDVASIDEDDGERVEISDTLADYCAISTAAQTKALAMGLTCDTTLISAALAAMDSGTGEAQGFYAHLRSKDSFNWGYDPYHYTVPEGSYASDPRSLTARILEFRTMVQALHDMDLMVIMDVVYNHASASGIADKSVLDKIVPGYYHRRDVDTGSVNRDSKHDDSATEHKMMAKLMTDSLVIWADDYNIDGFRFDLMGLQSKAAMEQALAAVQAVNPDIYFYGEGWDYGAAGENQRGANASQTNIGGTGIGTFTDRLRDSVRGGGPFDELGDTAGEDSLRRNQGLANAAVANELNLVTSLDPDVGTTDDNSLTPDLELAASLLANADLVRLGLAGNLKTFVFTNSAGNLVNGTQIDYSGQPAAYADDPQEIINYVSKHDNQTLWDIIAYKAADSVNSADRTRMQSLALATGTYAQGVPFYHLGADLLRSKSMERNSYDSGDWFNKVDFANLADNNWNVGLPREDQDGANWAFIEGVIDNVNANPSVTDVDWMRQSFQEMLTIRATSPLFRLTSADEVNNRVTFHNTGADQIPSLIAMSIDDGVTAGADLDANYDALMVIFNYSNGQQQLVVPDAAAGFTLHAIQQGSNDSVVTGASFAVVSSEPTFTVPALTAAVFVLAQAGAQGDGLPAGDAPTFGSATIYAVGAFSSWSHVYDGYYAGDDVYEFPVSLATAGTFAFRFADATWGNSTNADSFTNGSGSAFTLTAAGDGDNNFAITVAAGEVGDYLMQLDLSAAVPVVTISSFDFALAADIYVRGSITDPSWNPVAAGLFTYNNAGDYSVWIDAMAGDYNFKIADSAWTDGTNFGAGSISDVTLDTALLLDGASNENINITIPSDGYYKFGIDTGRSRTTPSLTVLADTPTLGDMFVRGDMNGWAASDVMTYDGVGQYSTTLALSIASYQFKFANADYSTALGFGTTQDAGSLALTDSGGNLFLDVTTAGDYLFTLDAINSVISVTLVP